MGTCGTESEAARLLTWTRTIDRTLVHRDAIAEVLLTDLIQVGPVEFLIAAQWPRSHRVYRPDQAGRHDPMLLLETVRQAGLAVSHLGFGVSFDQQSVMNNVGFRLNPAVEPRARQSATNLVIAVTCLDIVRRGNALRSMTVELRFAASGAKFAIGTGRISWLSRQTYTALRSRSGLREAAAQLPASAGSAGAAPIGSPAADPAATGAARPPARTRPDAPVRITDTGPRTGAGSAYRAAEDSLLDEAVHEPGPARRLIIPVDHPVYFDHPLDHAPGMVLIDAAWQATLAMRGDRARLVSCLMQCPTFTELGLETSIMLSPTSADTTSFSVEQAGRQTASGTLRMMSS